MDQLAVDLKVERRSLLQRGLWLEYFTVGWNAVEALISIAAGLAAGSIALVGFGLDSVIESLSGVVLTWRLRKELAEGRSEETSMERRSVYFVGLTFFLLSAYIVYESARKLILREAPEASLVGIIILIISLIIMPLLAWAKRRTAGHLESRALLADAKETLVCAYLSLTALLGVGINALAGWWWADPVAGLLMVPWIAREGWEAVRESTSRE